MVILSLRTRGYSGTRTSSRRSEVPLAFALFFAVISLLLFSPHAAVGSLLDVSDELSYTADPGEVNDVTVARIGSGITVSDLGAGIVIAGDGCVYVDQGQHQVLCSVDTSRFDVDVGDLNDRVTLAPSAIQCQRGDCFESFTELGSGDDQFRVEFPDPNRLTSREVVSGGDGRDHIETGEGADSVSGGAGDDTLIGGPAYDPLNGHDGDEISGGPGADSLIGGPDADAIMGEEGNDTLDGGNGDDRLRSGPGGDFVGGGFGNDYLDAAGNNFGDDTLEGGSGDDTIESGVVCEPPECAQLPQTDGADTVIGGAGYDTVGYWSVALPVTVSLDSEQGDGQAGEGDNVLPDVERVAGGGGADTLIGSDVANTLLGGAGNDLLEGRGGDDESLDGDGGNDTIRGGSGNDHVLGGGGDDSGDGDDGDDELEGNDGADSLNGGDGNDEVMGGPGRDSVNGDFGADRLDSPSWDGITQVNHNYGDDTLDGGPGDDVHVSGLVCLGFDCAQLPQSDGADTFIGGPGRDTASYFLSLAPVSVTLDGAADDGRAGEQDNLSSDVEDVFGGQAGDLLVGAEHDNLIDGGGGSDVIVGAGGNDSLEGGASDPGSDSLSGGAGSDSLRGGPGEDSLEGAAGLDSLAGGGGGDALMGGTENDSLSGGPGPDSLAGGAGDDDLNGSEPALIGADGADNLKGDEGNDLLRGGDGDDMLAGGPGADSLSGEAGSDTADYATGGSAVAVTLDDKANDGEAKESDNVRTDVEGIRGSGDEDTLTGSSRTNPLDGGAGEDYLDGAPGSDDLKGGDQIDVLRARDGIADLVDCGRGADLAIVDPKDRVSASCERQDVGVRNRPRFARHVVVQPLRGSNGFGLPGMRRTVPLKDRINLPLSSKIDSSQGRVALSAAKGERRASARALFYGGTFQVRQRRSRKSFTELLLMGGDQSRCRSGGSKRAAMTDRKVIRHLWGSGHGRFKIRGRYSSAIVRGTLLVEDRCDGTLARATRGTALVFDFRRKRAFVLRAGQRHLARALP
jgi:Ca2+-binding RTX toxin-like protein